MVGTLRSPHIPELISACPMLDFTEPINKGSLRLSKYTLCIAITSAGSPAGVPGINYFHQFCSSGSVFKTK